MPCMMSMVMDDLNDLQRLELDAHGLPAFDRLVMQLRWADDLTRAETAQVLDVEPARVLAAEMRLRAWITAHAPAAV